MNKYYFFVDLVFFVVFFVLVSSGSSCSSGSCSSGSCSSGSSFLEVVLGVFFVDLDLVFFSVSLQSQDYKSD